MSIQIIFIWCDINNISDEYNIYNFIFYNNQQNCIDYIKSILKTETIFLITSIEYAIKILSEIHNLRQLNSIFIYTTEEEYKIKENFLDKYTKIIGIYFQLKDLFLSIKKTIQYTIQQIESYKFYEKYQKSTRELTKESASFLWLRLFKDIILKLPHNEQAKQEMFDKLNEFYHNDNKQLKLINQFFQEYKSEYALKSYTKELFLYTQLNRALRTEDIELLYKFRYFISDLSKNLYKQYDLLKYSLDSILTFYRGVKLLNTEVNKFEDNIGKLISTNGYLSTSFSRNVALSFSGESTNNETSVLFEIQCDLENINSIIMASIAHLSQHRDEEEVLFDLDAAFEIISVSKDESLKKLIVKMKATDEGSILAQEYINEHSRQINTTSVVLMYGRLLTEIGQYDKSQDYFQRLLENPNGEDLAFIYYQLGAIHYNKGNYEKAIEYYEYSYNILINTIPSREGASANVLNDIGSIFNIRGQYDKALDYYMHALKISEKLLNYHSIAISLGNLGIIYRIKGEYDLALDYHIKCHKIQEKYLPSQHKDIARTLNHIAAVYNDKDDLSNAMIYHQKSLQMSEICLPIGHDYIASNLNHIATILTNQGKYNEALDYYNHSLKIKENIFSNGHLSIVKILNKIGYIYYLKKDYNLAFDYLNKSIKIREILYFNINDISLINNFTNFGLVLIKQQKFDDALEYLKRAFNLAQILLPIGHEDITDCLTNIGIIYREMNEYTKAFEYFEKASKNEEENRIKPNLIRLARIYDNMGICLCNQKNNKIGLKYRLKAVRLINQLSPRIQHADWICTIGNEFIQKKLYNFALECYLISLNMRLECLPNDHIDIAENLMYLGDVYIKKELKIQARFYYQQSLNIYEKNEHINTIDILNCIGNIYENLYRYYLAFEYYKKALVFSEKYFSSNNFIKEINQNNIARIKWLIK